MKLRWGNQKKVLESMPKKIHRKNEKEKSPPRVLLPKQKVSLKPKVNDQDEFNRIYRYFEIENGIKLTI